MKRDLDPRKPGKGRPDINSSVFLQDLGSFVHRNIELLTEIARLAVDTHSSGFVYMLLNTANALFMGVDFDGVCLDSSTLQRQKWLLASWCIMLAAELQVDFPLLGWSTAERVLLCHKLFDRMDTAHNVDDVIDDDDYPRMDLLPRVAMVRLGIHQELCMAHMGLEAASSWKYEGVRSVAARMGSAKRHFDAALWDQVDEDHIIHLLWNMMAIYHTCVCFPERNDCRTVPVFMAHAGVHLLQWALDQ